MATAKDCHILTSYYVALFKEKYDVAPVVNRHSARWGFDSVLIDMKVPEAKELLEYYFKTNNPRKHNLEWFLYNYEKLIEAMVASKKDAERRARLREESAERAREWRERGNSGIGSN